MENNISAILEGLNDEQTSAVKATEGPVLIVAGAGSGKTRVLTSRIAYILSGGADPARILALTFTKKAASEMKERIALMVGAQNARRLVMGTFHSVFIRILRDYADLLGYPKDFTIYDTSDSQSAIKTIVKQMELDEKIYKPKDVLGRISAAKNNLVLPGAYRSNSDIQMKDYQSKKPKMGEIYAKYQEVLKQSGVMDFDDILVNMNILLKDFPDAWHAIADRFSYIMVDEYQDTNFAQYLVLKRLAYFHQNICVVGDDSQSIYAFRGAKIENILNFQKDYPKSKIVRLERNYRSTGTIVDAANSVIAHNEGRIKKQCYAVGEKGNPIHIISATNESEEAALIAMDLLTKMREHHAQYQDFAILYRTNAQSRAIEEALRRRNLPYMIYSGNSFFERAEIKDMMCYFKLVVNPSDNEALRRIINKPARGIGDTTVNVLEAVASAHQCPMLAACLAQDLEAYKIRGGTLEKVRAFGKMISDLHDMVQTTDAYTLSKKIADDSQLYQALKADTSIEGLARVQNVEELISSVANFVEEKTAEAEENMEESRVFTLGDFLEEVSLLSNVDVSEDEDDSNKIALMTVHSAKGLEFPFVYIAGLEEELFPSGGMLASPADIEEERRLFYVALTRAKQDVVLTRAYERMRNGQHQSNPASRFIGEIAEEYLDNPLEKDEFTTSAFGTFSGGFGAGQRGFGSKFTPGGSNRFPPSQPRNAYGKGMAYGQSGVVHFEKRGTSSPFGGRTSSPSQRPAPQPMPVPKPSFTKPSIIDDSFVPEPMGSFHTGERITHNRFGAGTIRSMSGTAPEIKAIIDFDAHGEKTLLLKYAKMKHI